MNKPTTIRGTHLTLVAATAMAAGLSSGCASDDVGTGSLEIGVNGGIALQEGFPHTEGAVEHAFVDGWSLQLTKYIMVLDRIRLTDPADGDAEVASWDGPVMIDLHAGGGDNKQLAVLGDLPATRLDMQFDVIPASAGTEARDVDSADAVTMIDDGLTYLIEGQAEKDGQTIAFRLGLDGSSRYSQCTNGKDNTQGVAIEAEKTVGVFVWHHPHHLWWDVAIAAGNEQLRFDAWAAVAGADDLVTAEELETQDLTDLQDAAGDPLLDEDGDPVFYDSGPALKPDELNLLAFVRYAARAAVHFNGLGFCTMTVQQ